MFLLKVRKLDLIDVFININNIKDLNNLIKLKMMYDV